MWVSQYPGVHVQGGGKNRSEVLNWGTYSDLINSFKDPQVKEIQDSGHTLMSEDPNKVLDYLIEIL